MVYRVQVLIGKFLILFSIVTVATCILTEILPEDSCVCVTEEAGVSRKAGYFHPIVRYLFPGACVLTAGNLVTVYGAKWYNLKVDSEMLWCDGKYLINGTISNDVCSLS